MINAPGNIRQLGFIVRDLDEAVAQWLAHTSAGPFVVMRGQRFDGWTYLGEPQDQILDIAFAQAGPMMIELIEAQGPWPNVYGDAPPTETCVLHHFGLLVADIEAASAALDAPLVTTAQIDAASQLRYFDCRERFGVRLELISDTPSVQAFFELSESLARSWDGTSAPVRRFEEVTG